MKTKGKETERNQTPAARRVVFSYPEVLAFSVISYAKKNPEFENWLSGAINGFELLHSLSKRSAEESEVKLTQKEEERFEIILPEEEETAMARTSWLLERISKNDIPGIQEAGQVFAAWSMERTWESPKAIVLGIAVGVMPFITLGEMKKKNVMPFIFNVRKIKEEILVLLTDSLIKLFIEELHAAKGDMRKFDPDFADWLFGSRASKFYIVEKEKLHEIKQELASSGILHGVSAIQARGESDGDTWEVVAITPAADNVVTHFSLEEY